MNWWTKWGMCRLQTKSRCLNYKTRMNFNFAVTYRRYVRIWMVYLGKCYSYLIEATKSVPFIGFHVSCGSKESMWIVHLSCATLPPTHCRVSFDTNMDTSSLGKQHFYYSFRCLPRYITQLAIFSIRSARSSVLITNLTWLEFNEWKLSSWSHVVNSELQQNITNVYTNDFSPALATRHLNLINDYFWF